MKIPVLAFTKPTTGTEGGLTSRALRLAYASGAALLLTTAGAAFVLLRDADVLALRLATRTLGPPKASPATPREAVEHFQCNRCHVIASLQPASAKLAENCVTCHQAISAGRMDLWYRSTEVERWRLNLTHLVRTPDLESIGQRVKRSWLVGFLQAPHVVRPLYGATMPRLPIGPREAALIADFFQVTEEESPEPPVGDAAAGQALYAQRGCADCHSRGDSAALTLRYGAPEFKAPSARRRAPDLQYAPARMSRPQLRRWLEDPRKMIPDSEMPAFSFSARELDDLVAFLSVPLPEAKRLEVRRPRVLQREVRYPEVAQKLSRHLCFHCHSDQNRPGDQGPGNTGGFGYFGVALDLATREGIVRGVRRDGQFRGQPDRLSDGTPRLVASLLARQAELQGQVDPEVLGMPLGFPPIPDDEIDLINTWLEQGALE